MTSVPQGNESVREMDRAERLRTAAEEVLRVRQSELNYIRDVLNAIRKREGEPARTQCLDLLLWCDSRATVLPWPPEAPKAVICECGERDPVEQAACFKHNAELCHAEGFAALPSETGG